MKYKLSATALLFALYASTMPETVVAESEVGTGMKLDVAPTRGLPGNKNYKLHQHGNYDLALKARMEQAAQNPPNESFLSR
jgi:hypothetical protein